MLGKNNRQLDFFDSIIYEQLIPKDHLLIKIDEAFDFDFLYKEFEERYSSVGRASKDPVMMVKILLLEYIYVLSDVQVAKRIQTDIAFRWFLGLGVKDKGPDDTTISHFRIKRMTEKDFEMLFISIVKQCIDRKSVV